MQKIEHWLEKYGKWIHYFLIFKIFFFRQNEFLNNISDFIITPIMAVFSIYYLYKAYKNKTDLKEALITFVLMLIVIIMIITTRFF